MYPRVNRGIQGLKKVCKSLQEFTRDKTSMQGLTRLVIQGFTGVYKGLHGSTRVNARDKRGYKRVLWVYKGLQGYPARRTKLCFDYTKFNNYTNSKRKRSD